MVQMLTGLEYGKKTLLSQYYEILTGDMLMQIQIIHLPLEVALSLHLEVQTVIAAMVLP